MPIFDFTTGYYLSPLSNPGMYMNRYGEGTIKDNQNVNLYIATGAPDQRWRFINAGSDNVRIASELNNGFALNIWRGASNANNCDVCTIAGNATDSLIKYYELTPPGIGGTSTVFLKFQLVNYPALYLTVVGNDLRWTADKGTYSFDQLFAISTTQDATPPDPPTPEESDSTLVTKFIPAYTGNYTKDRSAQGSGITEITVHHCAGIMTIESLGQLWQKVGREGSSHYGVSENKIGQYVRECDVAWCNGGSNSPNGWAANCRAVTIETSNNGGAPNWPVSDTTLQTLIRLVADIAKRNGLGKLVKGTSLTWHSMYAATACPGPYLSSKLQFITDEANKINGYV
ncbi:MAG: N-acetylmuramoyl-L-alanine amidase [Ruthenibacterium sp.]